MSNNPLESLLGKLTEASFSFGKGFIMKKYPRKKVSKMSNSNKLSYLCLIPIYRFDSGAVLCLNCFSKAFAIERRSLNLLKNTALSTKFLNIELIKVIPELSQINGFIYRP